jgi:hypothetical protein
VTICVDNSLEVVVPPLVVPCRPEGPPRPPGVDPTRPLPPVGSGSDPAVGMVVVAVVSGAVVSGAVVSLVVVSGVVSGVAVSGVVVSGVVVSGVVVSGVVVVVGVGSHSSSTGIVTPVAVVMVVVVVGSSTTGGHSGSGAASTETVSACVAFTDEANDARPTGDTLFSAEASVDES